MLTSFLTIILTILNHSLIIIAITTFCGMSLQLHQLQTASEGLNVVLRLRRIASGHQGL